MGTGSSAEEHDRGLQPWCSAFLTVPTLFLTSAPTTIYTAAHLLAPLWQARCHRNEELWSRETESRQMWIKILRQENLYFRQQHHMLERKKQKIQWDKRYGIMNVHEYADIV